MYQTVIMYLCILYYNILCIVNAQVHYTKIKILLDIMLYWIKWILPWKLSSAIKKL